MRHGGSFRFGFGFPPLGFWFRGPRYFPRKEEYKKELEAELRDVEQEIKKLKGEG